MKLSELDNLLSDQSQLKAPSDFTNKVMCRVLASEIETNFVSNRFYQLGKSLIAASLIVMLINFTPFLSQITRKTNSDNICVQDFGNQSFNTHTVNTQEATSLFSISETIDYYTLKFSNTITKPFNFLTKSIYKEDLYYE